MQRFIVVLILALWILTSVQGPTAAYYADFDDLTPGTPASNIVLEGVHFWGADWLVRDMNATGLYPATLSHNALRGCYSTLTVKFDAPQRVIGFNFEFNTYYNDDYTMTMVASREGKVLETANYRGQLGHTWRYPEAYALMATGDPFDTVTISHNAQGFCLYIDNLITDKAEDWSRLGQVYISAPGTALYDQAGGGIVRDASGQEMRVPNPTATDPAYDVYNVLGEAVVDGQVWVQIFTGDVTNSPWIPLGPTTRFLLYGT